jgi:streptogramin lyase
MKIFKFALFLPSIAFITACGGGGTPAPVIGTPAPVIGTNAVVTTLAGTAQFRGSTDATGADARFNQPTGVAVDANGNVYVADSQNHTIRKITSAGIVTTLAGTAGQTGSTDATGAAARFNEPTGVAVDANANVYVADMRNHTIRKITAAGVVTTLAGTVGQTGSTNDSGTAARFNQPTGVAVDANGNVYVADSKNHTIRKITAAGEVTTFAGKAGQSGSTDANGVASQFYNPYGVAVDANGNVYVADMRNETIRKITATGAVTTLAGSLGQMGSNDASGTAALFNSPSGVAVDANENVYVADAFNNSIRKITAAGVVTTLAGGQVGSTDATGTAARFHSPTGVAVDANANFYVADTINRTIRKITMTP